MLPRPGRVHSRKPNAYNHRHAKNTLRLFVHTHSSSICVQKSRLTFSRQFDLHDNVESRAFSSVLKCPKANPNSVTINIERIITDDIAVYRQIRLDNC